SNDRGRVLCGDDFRGILTRFDVLGSVVEFATKVSRTIPGQDEIASRLRHLLLEEEMLRVNEAFSWLSRSDADAVDVFLRDLPADLTHHIDQPLDLAREGIDIVAAGLEAEWQKCHELGVAPDVLVADLPALDGRLAELRDDERHLGQSETVNRLLEGIESPRAEAEERL